MPSTGKYIDSYKLSNQHQVVTVKIDVIEYKEDGIFYVYSPALDLVGYCNTLSDARRSWDVVLDEYLHFTANNNSLIEDLQKRGWKIKARHAPMPPTFSWLVQKDDNLTEMINKHDYKKKSKPIHLTF
ncbi:hypothetical protein QTN47_03760 [Danxiaibacter flavus]|uniref:Phage protein n=1 Tax=Danxiaibacter flavus TaxID=3049108 RepID=A0ABV3ZBI6_9BACT|nr:hypothetical protein QNM32_03760 [Chitinophagaceae bacterium DXS]